MGGFSRVPWSLCDSQSKDRAGPTTVSGFGGCSNGRTQLLGEFRNRSTQWLKGRALR